MFSTLEDSIHSTNDAPSRARRFLWFAAIFLLSCVLFGGLFALILLLG